MKINKKLILLSAIVASLITTGCSAKDIPVNLSASSWKNKISINKDAEDCKGDVCLASIAKPKVKSKNIVEEVYPQILLTQTDVVVGDESITPQEEQYFATNTNEIIEYDYSDSPFLKEDIELIATNDIAVQVGAFRKFAGATSYAKRYSLMSNQYYVAIEKDMKDKKPIYRVHVNGFNSNIEAENFIDRYGSQGAFLVRK